MTRFLLILTFLVLFSVYLLADVPWPLAPMNQQHRISGTFGECRGDRDHFHEAVDIPLAQGGNVLASQSGTVISLVTSGSNSYIRVGRFAYVHVVPDPALGVGDFVSQGQIIGITNNLNHIHFKDGGGGSGYELLNPLREGALSPFNDPYKPNHATITLYPDGSTQPFPGNTISGRVDIVVHASDVTDLESQVDMNNGIYKIGYAIYNQDTSEIIMGPYLPYTFLYYPPSSAVELVYFQGSSTSEYYYIVTNSFYGNGYWDTSQLPPGDYVIAAFSYDIKMNADTTYKLVHVVEADNTAPPAPQLQSVHVSEDTLIINWTESETQDLRGFRLYYKMAPDDNWHLYRDESELPADVNQFTLPNFTNTGSIYFAVSAVDNAPTPNESKKSKTYGISREGIDVNALIVDGQDGLQEDELEQFNILLDSFYQSLEKCRVSFESCLNQALKEGEIDPERYNVLIWLLGDEDSASVTLDSAEISLIKAYLESGGNLLISGANLGEDLYFRNDSGFAREFYRYFLKAEYVKDSSSTREVIGRDPISWNTAFSVFSGVIGGEESLEVIEPVEGAGAVILYGNTPEDTTEVAGIAYEGLFSAGDTSAAMVYLAFPLTQLQPAYDLLSPCFSFFGFTNNWFTNIETKPPMPASLQIINVFPNPFNSSIHITGICFPDQPLTIRFYDLSGRLLAKTKMHPTTNFFSLQWKAQQKRELTLPSGHYLIQVEQGKQIVVKQITYLK